MFLMIRMTLYLVTGLIAGQGFEFFTFDRATGDVTVTFNVESLALTISGLLGFVGTFIWSFWDRLRGPAKLVPSSYVPQKY